MDHQKLISIFLTQVEKIEFREIIQSDNFKILNSMERNPI